MVTAKRQAEIDERKRLRLEREAEERKARGNPLLNILPEPFQPTQPAPEFQPPIQEPIQEPEAPRQPTILTPEERARAESERGVNIITDEFGNERIQTREDLEQSQFRAGQPATGGEIIEGRRIAAAEGQQLAGQVGQFDPLGVSPTGLNFADAATQGAIGSIPSAIRTAGSLAILGAAGGAAGGPVTALAGAAIGGAVGFVSGITGGMIGDLKGQRSDTVTAQQRILDEGKQTMKDWASWAEADPANKARYLAEFNKVSAQIDQAYRQMKLDTSRDVAKFETALPNLAEFETFYSAGGERDELNNDMRFSLTVPASIDNTILQMVERRK